ncbi:unnamed protein product, partial [Amoebophrya sp. A120]
SGLVAASVAPGAATSRRSAGARFDPRLWADKCDARSHLCGADVAARSLLHASLLYLVAQKTLRSSADTLYTEPELFHHCEGCRGLLLRTYGLEQRPHAAAELRGFGK